MEKFKTNLGRRLSAEAQTKILAASTDQATLEAMPVGEYVTLYTV